MELIQINLYTWREKLSTQSRDITFNHIFKHLLDLTQLNEDPDTLIQLFNEQGLTIDVQRIEAWTKDYSDPSARRMPKMMFCGFMNILMNIKNEAQLKEINLFDLRGILEDIREAEVV